MLSVKQYPADHLQDSRDRFNERILRFNRLTTTISERDPAALAELEHDFAELMVVSLDAAFVHRVRAQEGKDGNPLNEVRMLADSILTNQSVLAGSSTIRYDPGRSIVGTGVGEPIRVSLDQLSVLGSAFHDEIAARYG